MRAFLIACLLALVSSCATESHIDAPSATSHFLHNQPGSYPAPPAGFPMRLLCQTASEGASFVRSLGGQGTPTVTWQGGIKTLTILVNEDWAYSGGVGNSASDETGYVVSLLRRRSLRRRIATNVPASIYKMIEAIHQIGSTDQLEFNPVRLLQAMAEAKQMKKDDLIWSLREYVRCAEDGSWSADGEGCDSFRAILLARVLFVPVKRSESELPPVFEGEMLASVTLSFRENGLFLFPIVMWEGIPFLLWSAKTPGYAASTANPYLDFCDTYCELRSTAETPANNPALAAESAAESLGKTVSPDQERFGLPKVQIQAAIYVQALRTMSLITEQVKTEASARLIEGNQDLSKLMEAIAAARVIDCVWDETTLAWKRN